MDESRSKRSPADAARVIARQAEVDRGTPTGGDGIAHRGEYEFPIAADNVPFTPAPLATPRRWPARPAPSAAVPPSEPAIAAFAPASRPYPWVAPPPAPHLAAASDTGTAPAPPPVEEAHSPVLTPPAPIPDPRAETIASLPHETIESLPFETSNGLEEKPFSLSTDPKFLYHSTAHDRTAQALLTSIGKREGVVVITGPPGIGKTSLCRAVIEELDRRTLTSFLVDPFLSVDDLLQTLLIDFGVLSRDDLAAGAQPSTYQLRVALQSFLASLAPLDASAVVLIDEAQNLPVAVLDELGALAEIGEGRHLLHVVLIGEPALLSRLKHRDLRPLNEHVVVRSKLGPLLADEIDGYVTHRLEAAGSGHAPVAFNEDALVCVFGLTGGNPRMVNLLCDRAMTRGHEASASVIDAVLVAAAAKDLELSAPVVAQSQTLRLVLAGLVFALLMLVGAAAAAWVFRDDVRRAIRQWERTPQAPAAPQRPVTQPVETPRR